MDYTKTVSYSQPETLSRLKEALKENRWGVLSDIDVKSILKEKVGADIESYNILDVCNPRLADQALKLNRKAGLVLPCKMAGRRGWGCTCLRGCCRGRWRGIRNS